MTVSAQGSTAGVVGEMRAGVAAVGHTPFDPADIEAALTREGSSQSRHTMLFGAGAAMTELRDVIDRVIDMDVPVLIQGESGTGKELVARALAASPRRCGKPFIKINCAALPSELLEAELFGYERGAFTGAIHAHIGRFEDANDGTIFLDEVGEIPLHLQAKLLQVLQDGHFSRLGGLGEIHATARVIAATNCDLDQAVIDGQFRQDLLFRVNVIPIRLPPLRERLDDIPLLAEFFLKRWTASYKRPYSPISPEVMDGFLGYDWPGNIRELENTIKRIVVLGIESHVRKTLPLEEAVDPKDCSLKRVARRAARQAEATIIMRALQRTRGNRRQAAKLLGISYKTFFYKTKEDRLGAQLEDAH